ncbi:DUF4113 domain-containing protein [Pontibacter sp. BT310]|uniref:DUF4113 domain-containing protein n=1 Tax=Pontibacter populi TaxID=890055 RepID=A0ABS6XD21_9BACT|nr:DUF4113 domain-containing protein [Pontibacter sp. BT310]MBR0571447.1 DUF4113 domain-containing protein [Microvirga sp. STS03]MBW3365873.1 DUF4113 domain-containing protein [Pontibacter populi]
MRVMDMLTDRLEKVKVQIAAQGIDKSWLLKSYYKSPCYTKRLSEIPTVFI